MVLILITLITILTVALFSVTYYTFFDKSGETLEVIEDPPEERVESFYVEKKPLGEPLFLKYSNNSSKTS